MKLFITNQKEFRELISKSETSLTETNIHKLAFNKLVKKLNKFHIPKIIYVEIGCDYEICFSLISFNNDVYSYEAFSVEPLPF
jgi:hypothetical protein